MVTRIEVTLQFDSGPQSLLSIVQAVFEFSRRQTHLNQNYISPIGADDVQCVHSH